MDEKRKQYKLQKEKYRKGCTALALKTPLTLLATTTVLGLAVSQFLLINYVTGEHIFKRDYNTTYAYQETIDTFGDTYTTTSEINYDKYESILGNQEKEQNSKEPVLPKSYVTEYSTWKELGNGEYARSIKYYDVGSFDYEKALKLLSGVNSNQDINIEEYFSTPVIEDVEISKNNTNNTKYQLTYYSIDEENNIVTKESYLEHAAEMLGTLLFTSFIDFLIGYLYVIFIAGELDNFPVVYNMWIDLINKYQDVISDKKKLKELKALLQLKENTEDSYQLTKK